MTTKTEKTHNRRWLALYTRMHHERKVRDRLTDRGIECFVPIQTVVRQWSDRKKKMDKVLISMMVFVHVDADEQRQALEDPAVSRYMVLRGEHVPAVIPDRQMEYFRFMVSQSDVDVSFNAECLQVGQKVRVIKGPLMGLVGELVTVGGKSSVAIRVEMLGCAMVEVSVGMIEKA